MSGRTYLRITTQMKAYDGNADIAYKEDDMTDLELRIRGLIRSYTPSKTWTTQEVAEAIGHENPDEIDDTMHRLVSAGFLTELATGWKQARKKIRFGGLS